MGLYDVQILKQRGLGKYLEILRIIFGRAKYISPFRIYLNTTIMRQYCNGVIIDSLV